MHAGHSRSGQRTQTARRHKLAAEQAALVACVRAAALRGLPQTTGTLLAAQLVEQRNTGAKAHHDVEVGGQSAGAKACPAQGRPGGWIGVAAPKSRQAVCIGRCHC